MDPQQAALLQALLGGAPSNMATQMTPGSQMMNGMGNGPSPGMPGYGNQMGAGGMPMQQMTPAQLQMGMLSNMPPQTSPMQGYPGQY